MNLLPWWLRRCRRTLPVQDVRAWAAYGLSPAQARNQVQQVFFVMRGGAAWKPRHIDLPLLARYVEALHPLVSGPCPEVLRWAQHAVDLNVARRYAVTPGMRIDVAAAAQDRLDPELCVAYRQAIGSRVRIWDNGFTVADLDGMGMTPALAAGFAPGQKWAAPQGLVRDVRRCLTATGFSAAEVVDWVAAGALNPSDPRDLEQVHAWSQALGKQASVFAAAGLSLEEAMALPRTPETLEQARLLAGLRAGVER